MCVKLCIYHRTVLIIFPLNLKTIVIALVQSTRGVVQNKRRRQIKGKLANQNSLRKVCACIWVSFRKGIYSPRKYCITIWSEEVCLV